MDEKVGELASELTARNAVDGQDPEVEAPEAGATEKHFDKSLKI